MNKRISLTPDLFMSTDVILTEYRHAKNYFITHYINYHILSICEHEIYEKCWYSGDLQSESFKAFYMTVMK